MTPLQEKIVNALTAAPHRRMSYHDLMLRLWPPSAHPKAWRYSANGGPPGCAMAFGRALGQLQRLGVLHEQHDTPRRERRLSVGERNDR